MNLVVQTLLSGEVKAALWHKTVFLAFLSLFLLALLLRRVLADVPKHGEVYLNLALNSFHEEEPKEGKHKADASKEDTSYLLDVHVFLRLYDVHMNSLVSLFVIVNRFTFYFEVVRVSHFLTNAGEKVAAKPGAEEHKASYLATHVQEVLPKDLEACQVYNTFAESKQPRVREGDKFVTVKDEYRHAGGYLYYKADGDIMFEL